jgi:HTH-type transcriptional regulator/antitoxin MqsA
MRIHPETGATLHRDVRPFTVTYKGRGLTVDQPGWYPENDGDALFVGKDLEPAATALKRLKADEKKALAARVRTARQTLKLSQRKAGEMLGGGPRAFQKYEAGTAEPSQPMLNLLKLLENDPRRLKELKTQ